MRRISARANYCGAQPSHSHFPTPPTSPPPLRICEPDTNCLGSSNLRSRGPMHPLHRGPPSGSREAWRSWRVWRTNRNRQMFNPGVLESSDVQSWHPCDCLTSGSAASKPSQRADICGRWNRNRQMFNPGTHDVHLSTRVGCFPWVNILDSG